MDKKRLVLIVNLLFLISYVKCDVDAPLESTALKIEETTNAEVITINEEIQKESIDQRTEPNYEEVKDMEYGGTFENRTTVTDTDPIEVPEPVDEPSPVEIAKSETEWIEDPDSEERDVDLPRAEPSVQEEIMDKARGWPWVMAMTALVTAVALIIMIALLTYKYLTMKYRNRQVLIDEEDMIDPNDMKHFSI